MGTGETLFVLCAMILLGIIALSINATIIDSDSWVTNSQYSILAINVGQELFEEAGGKQFDENSVPSNFTPAVALGPEAGEINRSLFDDIDDYDGYQDAVSTAMGACSIGVVVNYVLPNSTDTPSPVVTSFKKVTVTVWNNYTDGRITLEHVFAYLGVM